MALPSRKFLTLSLSTILCLGLSTQVLAEMARYTFQLQAYDQTNLVKTMEFVTVAENDQQAATFASNKLAAWGQQLNGKNIKWNRLHAEPKGAVPLRAPAPTRKRLPGMLKIKMILFGLGEREFREGEWAGTKGQSRIMEGFSVSLNEEIPGVELEYMAHIQNKGDTNWVKAGTLLRGEPDRVDFQIFNIMFGHKEAERVEGVAFRLRGDRAPNYEIWYRGHIAGIGDTGWYKDGEFCGTRGQSSRLEAFLIRLSHK